MLENDMMEKASMKEPLVVVSGEKVQEMENADEYELTVTEESLMRLHGLSLTLPLPCDLCPIGTVFDNLEEFDAHMSEHPEAKMFACQLCNNTYKSWSNLVAHRKMFHFGEVLSCERCGTCKSHSRLEGSVHYPVGGKPHGCEECEVGLDTISDVYRHYFFHKAPPGGSRSRSSKFFGPAQKRKSARVVESVGAQDQSGGINLSTSRILSETMASDLSRNPSTNLGGASAEKLRGELLERVVTGPSNDVHGNMIVYTSDNVASAPDDTVVGNHPGVQNSNLIRNVVAIPSKDLIAELSGTQSGNVIMKSAGIQCGIMRKNLHGICGRSLLMKSAGILNGRMNENPIRIQSGNPNSKPSELLSVSVPETLAGNQTGIVTGNATMVQSHSTSKPPIGTQGGIQDGNLHGTQSDKQNKASPGIYGENIDLYLSEEPKSSLEKLNSNSQTVTKGGGLRPIAPNGLLNDPVSYPMNGPFDNDKIAMGHKHFCPHCTFSCEILEEYRNHLISNSRAHDCIMCSKNQFEKIPLTDHEYCQSQTQQFKCILCTAILESEDEFAEHLTKHHTAGYLPCCLCGKKNNWLLHLEHIKSCQHKFIEWKSKQQLCFKTCQPCGKVFHSAGALRRHMKRHDLNRKLKYDCKTCGRTFKHGGAYAKHLWANPMHGPPEQRAKIPGLSTNYICEKCGKTFSKREGLKGHLMRHAGVRPYACTSCPKAFVTRTSLVVHIRQHTGERPYMCEMCGKNFTGPTSLYVHQRKHRSDEGRSGSIHAPRAIKKPCTKHTCPVCGKILSSKLIFEGHVRQHTGERPFVCEICGRGFATAKIMRLHTKRHEKFKSKENVPEARWVHDISAVPNKVDVDIEGGFDSNSSSTCIFLCPRCGLGMVSPDELEEHLSKGDCPSGGAEMFVLPVTNEADCIDTGSMVDVD